MDITINDTECWMIQIDSEKRQEIIQELGDKTHVDLYIVRDKYYFEIEEFVKNDYQLRTS